MGFEEKILVSGGAGFLGSHLAAHLVEQGRRVTVLDNLSGGSRENVPPGCEFVEGDITDDSLVAKLFAYHKFDLVYHLAAYAAEGLSHFIRRFNYENNLIGSVTLLNAAIKAGTRRFVFTSSIAVYGSGQLPMTEDMTPCPEDPYGIAKRAFEMDLEAAAAMFGIEYLIFRPHNIYGEGQNIGDPYRNVVGIFMNRIMGGNPCRSSETAGKPAPSATSETSPRSSPPAASRPRRKTGYSTWVPMSPWRLLTWPGWWRKFLE